MISLFKLSLISKFDSSDFGNKISQECYSIYEQRLYSALQIFVFARILLFDLVAVAFSEISIIHIFRNKEKSGLH